MASRQFRIDFEAVTAQAERGFQKLAGESQNLTSKLEGTKRATLGQREAALRVEQAQQRAARATATYGRDSLQAAQASTRLEREQQKLNSTLSKSGKSTSALSGHLRNAASAAIGFGAALVSIHAAKEAVETTESLAKSTIVLKRNFGLSTEAASTWGAILKTNDIDQRSAMMSFTTLSKAIENGSKTSKAAFTDLGLSQSDLKRQNFSQTLDDVVGALSKMEGGSKRAADAQILLGRGAKTLAPLFRNDGLGFQQQAKWAKEYGVTLDGHALKSSKDLTIATTQLKYAQMGAQIFIAEKVVPTIANVAEKVAGFVAGMRDGTGAGGRFADKMKNLWNQLQPVLGTIKDIGVFLAHQPRLLALAAGAFVIWKTAAAAAAFQAKAKLIATFLGLGPKAAAGGVIAGTEFGGAASKAASTELRAFKWASLGRVIGLSLAGAIVYALQPTIDKLTGGGLSGNDTITPTKQGIFNLKEGPHGINRHGGGVNYPKLTKKPGGATGGVIAGPSGAGDIVPLWTKPGEVVLTEDMQNALGRDRVMRTVAAMGGQALGHMSGASTGGLIGGAADLYSYLSKQGFSPTSTTGGKHAAGSYHYLGEAIDYGNSRNNIGALANTLWPFRSQFAELFIPTSAPHGGLYHYGQRFSDPSLQAEHQDHIHVADTRGSFAGGGGSSSSGSGGWRDALLTWYKPSMGGINGRAGGGAWAGHPVDDTTWGCAAPPHYPFGSKITFSYKGKKVTCTVVDRGGAIQGNHFDLLPGPARALGIISGGKVRGKFKVGGSTGATYRRPSRLGITTDGRPAGPGRSNGGYVPGNQDVPEFTDTAPVSTAYDDVENAIGDVGLHVSAGDESPAQGDLDVRGILSNAINTGSFNGERLSPHEILQLRGQLGDMGPASTGVDNSALLQGIHDQLADMNARAKAITGTTDGVLGQWVTEFIMGRAGTSAGLGAQMPSSPGVVARLR
jgi:hypothetical protein